MRSWKCLFFRSTWLYSLVLFDLVKSFHLLHNQIPWSFEIELMFSDLSSLY